MGIFDSLGSVGGMTGAMGGAGIAIGAIGMIGSLISGQQLAGTESQIASDNSQIAGLDMQVNNQRQAQMQMNAQRQQMDNLRNLQRSRAQGLTQATSGGAQFGSGLSGSYGGASGSSATNIRNSSENEIVGNNIFSLDNQQDQLKMQIAGLQGTAATQQGNMAMWQGVSGLGNGMFSGASSFGKMFGNNS